MLLSAFFEILFGRKVSSQLIGDKGEAEAARFLKKKGMKILARNFRHGKYEIDIIALERNCIVFAEVKTRVENALVDGYYAALSPTKIRGIKECSRRFISQMPTPPQNWRYDIVDVRVDSQKRILSVKHFENILI